MSTTDHSPDLGKITRSKAITEDRSTIIRNSYVSIIDVIVIKVIRRVCVAFDGHVIEPSIRNGEWRIDRRSVLIWQ